jgi:hypothetical protein
MVFHSSEVKRISKPDLLSTTVSLNSCAFYLIVKSNEGRAYNISPEKPNVKQMELRKSHNLIVLPFSLCLKEGALYIFAHNNLLRDHNRILQFSTADKISVRVYEQWQ